MFFIVKIGNSLEYDFMECGQFFEFDFKTIKPISIISNVFIIYCEKL